ncbi:hypothetical protein [Nostoc sp.]|uniref:hypothetical protein n=1 Tax=Nostoc sp. TaxID=1180 RepID=UPI002FF6CE05
MKRILEVKFGDSNNPEQEKCIVQIPLEDVDFEELEKAIEESNKEEEGIATDIIWDWIRNSLGYTWKLTNDTSNQ